MRGLAAKRRERRVLIIALAHPLDVRCSPDSGAKAGGRCLLRCMSPELADCVAKLFCPSKRVRLIQDQASMRNVDSRIHSLRFDCCIFLFYSLSAMTFATQSAHRVNPHQRSISVAFGVTRTLRAGRTAPG